MREEAWPRGVQYGGKKGNDPKKMKFFRKKFYFQ